MKLLLEESVEGWSVHTTEADLNENITVDDVEKEDICFIGRHDNAKKVVLELLTALGIEHMEV